MAAKKQRGKAAKPKDPNAAVPILRNRKVRHEYEILRSYEAGMVLLGPEVKSLRAGDVQWGDAHGRLDDHGELWLYGLHVHEYREAGIWNHPPTRPRKLLLSRRELNQIAGLLQTKGLTIVPTQLHLRRGMVKCEIAICRGKKIHDKRQDMVRRSQQRDIEREMARRLK